MRCAVLLLGLLVLRLALLELDGPRLLRGRTPLVLGLLLGRPPRVGGRLLMLHRRLAPLLGAAVLGAAVLRTTLRLAVLVRLRLAVLVLPLLLHGRTPRVRLLLLRRAPRVLLLPGLARLLVLGGLLAVRVVRLLRLPVLLPGRGAAVLAARPRRRGDPLLVVVPARRLPVRAATAAREVGPAVHAEQIALLVRLAADRTVQGRHDTSPERTPARSRLDVRCSMSPLRGIPM
jgi:hypothetical protein